MPCIDPVAGMEPEALGPELGRVLVTLAKSSIERGLESHSKPAADLDDYPPQLRLARASFVTLTLGQELRGCIGSTEAHRPLAIDVFENALAAAFHDPRFAPLRREELPGLGVSVSVLSPLSPLRFSGEPALLAQLRPGIDGLLIEQGQERATYLPAVWAQLPEPALFLRELKRKAGIAVGGTQALRAWRYTVESFSA
ncbi:MAG: AmmeMemoRadiSam system protein A [Gammaproteobacteria bacterium]